jgi:hypothetical protein
MPEIAIQEMPWFPWEQAGPAGSWAWNATTRAFVLWSREPDRSHGREPLPGTPAREPAPQVHPED